jgi:hypothetical protein
MAPDSFLKFDGLPGEIGHQTDHAFVATSSLMR